MKTKIQLLLFFLVLVSFLNAEIKVASILGDNMVLQRNTEIKLWGKASPKQKLIITTGWNKVITTITCSEKGDWLVKVKTTEAGGPYSINIKSGRESVVLRNILLGEVWLCSGQSNMEMPVTGMMSQPVNGSNDALVESANTEIRLFSVKKNAIATPQDTCYGSWSEASAESVAKFSAVGYFYAKLLQRSLHVPVGIINSSWGGSRVEPWMNHESIIKFPEAYSRANQEKIYFMQKPSATYNGMIAPIINYTIKGAIWYQGEANRNEYNEYAALLTEMVAGWRKDFGCGNFPFYFVQIAPFKYDKSLDIVAALQRDEQLKAMSIIPNSGMISTIDLGEENCIHPAEKLTVAKRLSYWALAETYNFKGFYYKMPAYKSMSVTDSVATLTFENTAKGLTNMGKEIDCFEIAGADKIFYSAKYTINKQTTVLLQSKQVKTPVAVRYAFRNFPITRGYLYNTAGLPVPSFRTDNW